MISISDTYDFICLLTVPIVLFILCSEREQQAIIANSCSSAHCRGMLEGTLPMTEATIEAKSPMTESKAMANATVEVANLGIAMVRALSITLITSAVSVLSS